MLNTFNNFEDDHLKAVESVIEDAWKALKETQRDDGHWVFKLEADATIPAEYILLNHFIGEVEEDIEAKFANYIRSVQGDDGGWFKTNEAFATRWGDKELACRLMVATRDPDKTPAR